MAKRFRILSNILLGALFWSTTWALQSEQGTPRTDAIALHEKMAVLHQQAAECLKSGKSLDECKNQMMKGCPAAEIPQCTAVSAEELRRHSKTHEMEMGGIRGTQPSEAPSESK